MEFENIVAEIEYYDVFQYYDDILRSQQYRLPKLYIRDVVNPFELPIENFKKRYRFSQESVLYIVSLIKNQLVKTDNRGLPVAPEIAVLLTLRFYATASFQIVCGDLSYLSQSTVSNVVKKVSKVLAQLHTHYIKIPQGEQANINRQLFTDLGKHGEWPGLPGVDAAIDCTHIRITNTPGCQHHEAYRNRKSYFSINVQIAVGPRTEILDIVARWAGSTHDSRIFQMSSIYMKYTQGIFNGRLLGDSGYPTLPFLLTPVKSTPTDPASLRYNRAHVKTRNVVERTFGIWKRRFPCLSKGLGNKLETVSNIIVACAVLHNLSLILNYEITIVFDILSQNQEVDNNSVMPSTSSGSPLRNSIIENYFH